MLAKYFLGASDEEEVAKAKIELITHEELSWMVMQACNGTAT